MSNRFLISPASHFQAQVTSPLDQYHLHPPPPHHRPHPLLHHQHFDPSSDFDSGPLSLLSFLPHSLPVPSVVAPSLQPSFYVSFPTPFLPAKSSASTKTRCDILLSFVRICDTILCHHTF